MNGVIDQALAYLAQPPIKTQTQARTVNVGASTSAGFYFSPPEISGYTYIGIIGIANSHGGQFPNYRILPGTKKNRTEEHDYHGHIRHVDSHLALCKIIALPEGRCA